MIVDTQNVKTNKRAKVNLRPKKSMKKGSFNFVDFDDSIMLDSFSFSVFSTERFNHIGSHLFPTNGLQVWR